MHYFQVGFCNNKELVVYKKKKNTSSIFTSLEPILDLRDPKNQKYITQKTGFKLGNRSSHSWFKKYKVRWSVCVCVFDIPNTLMLCFQLGILCWR